MFSCWQRAVARASRMNRSVRPACWLCISLMATRRPSLVSRAMYTAPMPPRPSSRMISYWPMRSPGPGSGAAAGAAGFTSNGPASPSSPGTVRCRCPFPRFISILCFLQGMHEGVLSCTHHLSHPPECRSRRDDAADRLTRQGCPRRVCGILTSSAALCRTCPLPLPGPCVHGHLQFVHVVDPSRARGRSFTCTWSILHVHGLSDLVHGLFLLVHEFSIHFSRSPDLLNQLFNLLNELSDLDHEFRDHLNELSNLLNELSNLLNELSNLRRALPITCTWSILHVHVVDPSRARAVRARARAVRARARAVRARAQALGARARAVRARARAFGARARAFGARARAVRVRAQALGARARAFGARARALAPRLLGIEARDRRLGGCVRSRVRGVCCRGSRGRSWKQSWRSGSQGGGAWAGSGGVSERSSPGG